MNSGASHYCKLPKARRGQHLNCKLLALDLSSQGNPMKRLVANSGSFVSSETFRRRPGSIPGRERDEIFKLLTVRIAQRALRIGK
jgi:hypothetical protein